MVRVDFRKTVDIVFKRAYRLVKGYYSLHKRLLLVRAIYLLLRAAVYLLFCLMLEYVLYP